MKTNQEGIDLIKKHEGFRPTVYKDMAGKPTIGYGHLIKDGEHFTQITKTEAQTLLEKDVRIAEEAIRDAVSVELDRNQFSALVSFVYNIGTGAFRSSTLLKYLNNRNFTKIPEEIMRWHYVGSEPSRGLINRRAAEAVLFLT